MNDFRTELEKLINRHSMENSSNTPDWILAEYLTVCLKNFDGAVKARDEFYGYDQSTESIVKRMSDKE